MQVSSWMRSSPRGVRAPSPAPTASTPGASIPGSADSPRHRREVRGDPRFVELAPADNVHTAHAGRSATRTPRCRAIRSASPRASLSAEGPVDRPISTPSSPPSEKRVVLTLPNTVRASPRRSLSTDARASTGSRRSCVVASDTTPSTETSSSSCQGGAIGPASSTLPPTATGSLSNASNVAVFTSLARSPRPRGRPLDHANSCSCSKASTSRAPTIARGGLRPRNFPPSECAAASVGTPRPAAHAPTPRMSSPRPRRIRGGLRRSWRPRLRRGHRRGLQMIRALFEQNTQLRMRRPDAVQRHRPRAHARARTPLAFAFFVPATRSRRARRALRRPLAQPRPTHPDGDRPTDGPPTPGLPVVETFNDVPTDASASGSTGDGLSTQGDHHRDDRGEDLRAPPLR